MILVMVPHPIQILVVYTDMIFLTLNVFILDVLGGANSKKQACGYDLRVIKILSYCKSYTTVYLKLESRLY